MKKYSPYAYSDGSAEDDTHWEDLARARWRVANAEKAIMKTIVYLQQMIDVLETEKARYREAKDGERWNDAATRCEWAKAMIYWIYHNV